MDLLASNASHIFHKFELYSLPTKMATASAQPNERECPVCMNDFETPKILPCGYLLCRKCVIPLWKTNACPLCRGQIFDSPLHFMLIFKTMKIENAVNHLPTDFVMESLVQSARVLAKGTACGTCDANNKAEFICMQCLDTMCSSCHKMHKRMVATRSHDVESLSSVTPERLAASGPPLCADHGDKQFLFCQDHGLALCASCKDERHSQCQAVNKLDDEMMSAKQSLDTLVDRLDKGKEKLKIEIAEMDSLIKDVDISRHEDMAQIDKACDRLQTLVEEFRINMKRESEASHNSSEQKLYDNKNRCSEKLASVTPHKRIIFKAQEVSPRPALIHLAKALTKRVEYVESSCHQFMTLSRVGTSCEDMVRKIEEMLNKSLMY